MRRSQRSYRVLSFGAAIAFVSLSACTIFGGGDDSNGASSSEDGGSDAHDSGHHDSGSTRRDSGTSTSSDGGVVLPHDDAGHVIGPDGGPLLCDPQPLGSFSGGTYSPPVGPYTGACTQTDLTNYVSCVTGSDSSQCAQFESGGSRVSCGSCLLTPQTSSRWGATLGTDPPTSFLNGAGCYAIVFNEGLSSTGCAGKVQRAANCETTACDPNLNCAGSTVDEQTACAQSAAAGECATYETAAQTACSTKDAGGNESVCRPSDTTTLASFLSLFCGSAG